MKNKTKILLSLFIINAVITNCNLFKQTSGFINHPVTISFDELVNGNTNESGNEENTSKRNGLPFEGFTVFTKVIDKQSDRILYKDSDISYYILSGALLIGKNEKAEVTVQKNQIYIIPRGVEHILVPHGNKPVKLLVHQSTD